MTLPQSDVIAPPPAIDPTEVACKHVKDCGVGTICAVAHTSEDSLNSFWLCVVLGVADDWERGLTTVVRWFDTNDGKKFFETEGTERLEIHPNPVVALAAGFQLTDENEVPAHVIKQIENHPFHKEWMRGGEGSGVRESSQCKRGARLYRRVLEFSTEEAELLKHESKFIMQTRTNYYLQGISDCGKKCRLSKQDLVIKTPDVEALRNHVSNMVVYPYVQGNKANSVGMFKCGPAFLMRSVLVNLLGTDKVHFANQFNVRSLKRGCLDNSEDFGEKAADRWERAWYHKCLDAYAAIKADSNAMNLWKQCDRLFCCGDVDGGSELPAPGPSSRTHWLYKRADDHIALWQSYCLRLCGNLVEKGLAVNYENVTDQQLVDEFIARIQKERICAAKDNHAKKGYALLKQRGVIKDVIYSEGAPVYSLSHHDNYQIIVQMLLDCHKAILEVQEEALDGKEMEGIESALHNMQDVANYGDVLKIELMRRKEDLKMKKTRKKIIRNTATAKKRKLMRKREAVELRKLLRVNTAEYYRERGAWVEYESAVRGAEKAKRDVILRMQKKIIEDSDYKFAHSELFQYQIVLLAIIHIRQPPQRRKFDATLKPTDVKLRNRPDDGSEYYELRASSWLKTTETTTMNCRVLSGELFEMFHLWHTKLRPQLVDKCPDGPDHAADTYWLDFHGKSWQCRKHHATWLLKIMTNFFFVYCGTFYMTHHRMRNVFCTQYIMEMDKDDDYALSVLAEYMGTSLKQLLTKYSNSAGHRLALKAQNLLNLYGRAVSRDSGILAGRAEKLNDLTIEMKELRRKNAELRRMNVALTKENEALKRDGNIPVKTRD
eukprot:CAMPEP_0197524514 /NCGR_PEP_ID=MMETSP1318-20131121/9171_1 /TAXON_ID=552666 /ORGANISM="Partenskyella glossopodia, Strain RCC365" /LENGTH=830 /DNA_ID=CAMNT_0043077489 /DNA_START=37 /DNA_END=2529 /DNA_ORIENTATION=+